MAAPPSNLPSLCTILPADKRWAEKALAAWPRVRHRYLRAPRRPLPPITLFDSRCTYRLRTVPGGSPKWSASEHGGTVRVLEGPTFAVGPQAAFNSTDKGGFVIMSLPSIWRTVAPPMEIELELFLESVLFHELAHGLQADLTPLAWYQSLKQQGFPADQIGDDAVQDRFGGSAEYRAASAKVAELLYLGASARSSKEARASACGAGALIKARRSRFLGGGNLHWARLDDMALTSEGLGQWTAYRWLIDSPGVSPSTALRKLRSPDWSQDEGLGVFLLIDRLVPGWQRSFWTPAPSTATDLLVRACRAKT